MLLLQDAMMDIEQKCAGKGVLSTEVLRILWVLKMAFEQMHLQRRVVFVQAPFKAKEGTPNNFHSRQVGTIKLQCMHKLWLRDGASVFSCCR